MIKFTSNTDFDFDYPTVTLLKDASDLCKTASAKEKLKYEKTPHQTDIHFIALGAEEGIGANRNLDAFPERDCKAKHATFVESGRVHKNHKNKKSDPTYGIIKVSAYNDKMRRIELIIGLNEKDLGKNKYGAEQKSAADILDKIAKGETVEGSMASSQEYDCCSICGHKSKSANDRCEHIKNQLGEITKEGKLTYMINPNPNWFEFSMVRRGADRLAKSMSKMASLDIGNSVYSIGSGFEVPIEEYLISKSAADKRKIFEKLSKLEKYVDAVANGKADDSKDKIVKEELSKINENDSISEDTIDELRKFDPKRLLQVLAEHGIMFSPEDFSKYVFDDKVKEDDMDDMKSYVPSIFRDMEDDNECCGSAVNSEMFDPSSFVGIPKQIRKLVSSLMDDHSVFEKPVSKQVIKITILGKKANFKPVHKPERKNKFAYELAKQYASYQLSALHYMQKLGKLNDQVMLNTLIKNYK